MATTKLDLTPRWTIRANGKAKWMTTSGDNPLAVAILVAKVMTMNPGAEITMYGPWAHDAAPGVNAETATTVTF